MQGLDFTNSGNDKETYRYNFIIKNHRDVDDYGQFMAFQKPFSQAAGSAALDAQSRQMMDIDEWMSAYAIVSCAESATCTRSATITIK